MNSKMTAPPLRSKNHITECCFNGKDKRRPVRQVFSGAIAMKWLFVFLLFLAGIVPVRAEKAGARQELIRLMRKMGLQKELDAPVEVVSDESGLLSITDRGSFIVQYMIVGAASARRPDVVVASDVNIAPGADKIAVVTHGWTDKAAHDWPADIAGALAERTDPNEWVCAFFDWKGGAGVISPVDAAKYGRDIAGYRLVAALSRLPNRFRHVHLIGHSAGSWTINSAARLICQKLMPATLHLTYLDAYVPSGWDAGDLAEIKAWSAQTTCYAEHYYTRDITLRVTERQLPNTFNVDITAVDPWFKEHEFPYRWYCASITGGFDRFDEKKSKVIVSYEGMEYGFARSLEAGRENWQKSLTLKKGVPAIRLRPEKAPFGLDFLRPRRKESRKR